MRKSHVVGRAVGGLLLGLISATAVCAQSTPAYRLTRSVSLGAPDKWDYVVFDPGSHRVYVAHGDRVSVVDGHDGSILGEVEGIPGGTHGTAISEATGEGFTDDGKAGVAVRFDLKSYAVKGTVPAAVDADAIVLDRASGHVFVIEGDPATVTVIDPKSNSVIATINGGGKMEYAVADDRGSLYVNGEAKREILRINTRNNAIEARWPIPGCSSPHGLAIDTAAHRVFSSCKNGVLVIVSTDDGATVATVPIGKGSDDCAFDPKRKLIFSSNGIDGTLSVIREKDPDTFVSAATIKTKVSARTMAIDPDTGRLYIAAADLEPHTPAGRRQRPVPGSLKLLFFDPAD